MLEDGCNLGAVDAVRAIVKCQHNGFGRQAVAEDLTLVLGFGFAGYFLWGRVGQHHAVVFEDLLAAIELLQAGQVVLPTLSL